MSYICEVCGQELPEGEDIRIDGQCLCKGCFDALYVACDECGAIHKLSEMEEVEEYHYVDGKRVKKLVCPECLEREFVQCDDCGAYIRKDGDEMYITHDGRTICESCYSSDYFTCDDCGEVFPLDEVFDVNTGTWNEGHVCPNCAVDNYYQCRDCEEWFSEDYIHTDDSGTIICDDCYDDHWATCASCGRLVHIDDAQFDEDDDEYYCPDCAVCNVIHSYGYKPRPIFGTTDGNDGFNSYNGTDLTFGVELECDKGRDPRKAAKAVCELTDRLYCKHDGSLSNGYEIVTHPGTLAWHMNSFPWAAVCKVSLDHGFKSHDAQTCGLHIHIGNAQFGSTWEKRRDVMAKLAALVDVLWPEVEQFSRRGRGGCERWASRNNVVRSIRPGMDDARACRAMYDAADRSGRYVAVNTQNDSTVELRFNRGSLKPVTILASLQLASNLAKFAMTHTVNECLDAKWDDVVHSYEYEELTTYVNDRFADFTPCEDDRCKPAHRAGEAVPPVTYEAGSPEEVAEYFRWEPADSRGLTDGDIVMCDRIPESEREYTDAVAVEGHIGVHIGRYEGAAWAGSNNGQSLHHNCNIAIPREQWNVARSNLSVARELRNGNAVDTHAVYEALRNGFMPGDLVCQADPDSPDGRHDLIGVTGRIITFCGSGEYLYAVIRWNDWRHGHGEEGLVTDNSIWNTRICDLDRC